MAHIQKNIKTTFLAVLLTKFFVLISSVKKLFFTDEKMLFKNLLKQNDKKAF